MPTLVEGEEPRSFPLQMRAKANLLVIYRHVNDATTELKQKLVRIAVALVLPDGIVNGLLREAVLELESNYGQAVDEEREVERKLALVPAVAQLSCDAEAVSRISGDCLGVLR